MAQERGEIQDGVDAYVVAAFAGGQGSEVISRRSERCSPDERSDIRGAADQRRSSPGYRSAHPGYDC
ncbi:hypothetical protein D4Q52_01665 [Rhodopseudomonas palustris]|uniref:Uncharacterized protein n=1 Tax=Rhodopseudomonas palustris TaxID=1076 RepID=A0A418VRA7_RHOPL|nr:hypothetical protein D4Q52_01665 [Rhodopseudomonas palustris]